MKNLCPDILRQRLVIEGIYTANLSKAKITKFLEGLSKKLKMTIIYGPIVKDLAGDYIPKHKGFECVLIWAESGVSLYVWERFKFFTIDIYTCKVFDPKLAVSLVKDFFKAKKMVHKNV